MKMDNQPFSVLMSVYINEKPEFLQEALMSLTKQTVLPNEIVLVEDGPLTKELYAVIVDFKMKAGDIFKVYPLKENGGLGNALMYGLKKCQYELVARADSDDVSYENRFELQLAEFKTNEKLVMVGSDIDEFEENFTEIISKREVPHSKQEIYRQIKWKCPFNHPTVMYKKSKILEAGGYLSDIVQEDYALWIKMVLLNYDVVNVDRSLVAMRVGNGMYARRGGKRYFEDELRLQKYMLDKKVINRLEYVRNVVVRWIIRRVSPEMRKKFYMLFIRKKSK